MAVGMTAGRGAAFFFVNWPSLLRSRGERAPRSCACSGPNIGKLPTLEQFPAVGSLDCAAVPTASPAWRETAGLDKTESVEPARLGRAVADDRKGGGMVQGERYSQFVLGVVVVMGAVFLPSKLRGGKPVSIPANAVVTVADTAGFRGYVIGDPNAPVEIVEYVDFECIVCANWEQVQWPTVKASLIDNGKVLWRVRDYPLEMHRHPRVASHAVACANDQGKVWEATDEMFRTQQNDWSLVADPMPGLVGAVGA